MSNNLRTKTRPKDSASRFRVFEEAHEAVTKLRALKPLLSPQDEEALAILMDKELMAHLDRSLKEAEQGRVAPLAPLQDAECGIPCCLHH